MATYGMKVDVIRPFKLQRFAPVLVKQKVGYVFEYIVTKRIILKDVKVYPLTLMGDRMR